jgi:glycosyltransferase involved in cell wall biosynthesis
MEISFVTSHFGSTETIGFMPLIATGLAKQGHEVRGVQYEHGEIINSIAIDRITTRELYTPYWTGQWLFYRDWYPKIRSYLTEKNPDVVVTDRRCTVPTIKAAVSLDIPVVGIVPGFGFTRFNPQNFSRDKTPRFIGLPNSAKLQYLFVRRLHQQHSQWLPQADDVIAVSGFLQDRLQATYEIESTVVQTPVIPETVQATNHNPETITMVNPRTELKGGRIFIDIAEAMPDQDFLVAGGFASKEQSVRAESAPNITCLGWIDDMRKVYKRTAVLLVPSLVEEGGPRVIPEAFVNGIPVVGTTRGGIPEFISDAGETVDPPQDIAQWISKIKYVLENYSSYSRNATASIKQFDADSAVKDVENILRSATQQHLS